MEAKDELFWSLNDYQRFVQHPDVFARDWAADRIEHQYPGQAAENFVGLLADSDTYLRIKAAQTIGRSGDPRYEPALLAALAESQGLVRRWIVIALGQIRSPTLLPQLVAEVDAIDAKRGRRPWDEELASVLEALGYYPDPEARAALWRLVERYRYDDWLSYTAFGGLLRFADTETVPRLIQRYGQLRPTDGFPRSRTIASFADAAGLRRHADEVTRSMTRSLAAVLATLETWFDQPIPFSDTFVEALNETAAEGYAGLLPHAVAELDRVATERGDGLFLRSGQALVGWQDAWAAGGVPTGYRWRTLYAWQVISTLAQQPPADEEGYRRAVGLSLVLLGQVLTDEDNEALLRAAPDDEARRAALLGILSSPRLNVMPDVTAQVAELGPNVVPDLIEVLESGPFWSLMRALEALSQIAHTHPGAADAAVSSILDLINDTQSDFVLEAASDALEAIGPPAVAPAAARLGQGDMAYDIYVVASLGEIPTEASVDAVLNFIDKQGLDEMAIEVLTDLGHHRGIPVLKRFYEPGDRLLARALCTIGVLNDYTASEMDEWRATALADRAHFSRTIEGGPPETLSAPSPRAESRTAPAQRRAPSGRRQRKKRRVRAKGRRKAQLRRRKRRKKRR